MTDCKVCEGSGWQECEAVWCSEPMEHRGPCPACNGTGEEKTDEQEARR